MRLKEKNLLQKFAATETLKKFSAQGAKKVEYGSLSLLVFSQNSLGPFQKYPWSRSMRFCLHIMPRGTVSAWSHYCWL